MILPNFKAFFSMAMGSILAIAFSSSNVFAIDTTLVTRIETRNAADEVAQSLRQTWSLEQDKLVLRQKGGFRDTAKTSLVQIHGAGGRVEDVYSFDSLGQAVRRSLSAYDDQGRLASLQLRDLQKTGPRSVMTLSYQRDDQGRLKRVVSRDSANTEVSDLRYVYRNDGRIDSLIEKHGDTLVQLVLYRYHESPRRDTLFTLQGDGDSVQMRVTTYDAQGYATQELLRIRLNPSAWLTRLAEYQRASDGRLLEEKLKDGQGNVTGRIVHVWELISLSPTRTARKSKAPSFARPCLISTCRIDFANPSRAGLISPSKQVPWRQHQVPILGRVSKDALP